MILTSLHPHKKQDTVATTFESLILCEHDLTLANLACNRRTHKVNAIDLPVHSNNITVSEFAVHDGKQCPCGKTCCNPIASSDHAVVTATIDILRAAEHITVPRWTWYRSTDRNVAMTPFAPHFTLLATWITSIYTTARCDDRPQSQALINCIRHIWYGFAVGAITNCGKWKSHDYGRKVQPWWNKECHDAAVNWSRSFRSTDDSTRRSAAQHYKRTIQSARRRTITQIKQTPHNLDQTKREPRYNETYTKHFRLHAPVTLPNSQ